MKRVSSIALLIILAIAASALESEAQQSPAAAVHWAYSAYFGTGWYSLSGDRDLFIARVTPEWALAKPSFDGGDRRPGSYLTIPVSAGLDRFDIDDVLEAVDLDNVSFLSVNPCVDLESPVSRG